MVDSETFLFGIGMLGYALEQGCGLGCAPIWSPFCKVPNLMPAATCAHHVTVHNFVVVFKLCSTEREVRLRYISLKCFIYI